ncbi:MAG: hypothetical protein JXA33_12190 [Anaerolineae bacterium]|nr:hypothetical protein [Anaerolineae bacterium]
MNTRRFPLSPVMQLVVLVVGILGLIAIAAGIGWGLAQLAPESQLSPSVTVTTFMPTAVMLLTSTPIVVATSDSKSTSTPAPTSRPVPTSNIAVVLASDAGLYDVCRRYCQDQVADPSVLEEYARRVANVNNLSWGVKGPYLYEGQEITMLLCPE